LTPLFVRNSRFRSLGQLKIEIFAVRTAAQFFAGSGVPVAVKPSSQAVSRLTRTAVTFSSR